MGTWKGPTNDGIICTLGTYASKWCAGVFFLSLFSEKWLETCCGARGAGRGVVTFRMADTTAWLYSTQSRFGLLEFWCSRLHVPVETFLKAPEGQLGRSRVFWKGYVLDENVRKKGVELLFPVIPIYAVDPRRRCDFDVQRSAVAASCIRNRS